MISPYHVFNLNRQQNMNDILYIFHSWNRLIELSLVLDLSACVRSEIFCYHFYYARRNRSLPDSVARLFLLLEERTLTLHYYVFFWPAIEACPTGLALLTTTPARGWICDRLLVTNWKAQIMTWDLRSGNGHLGIIINNFV